MLVFHNHLIISIIRHASLSKTPPARESKVEGSLSVTVLDWQLGFKERLLSSRPTGSVEDGKEVNQAAGSPSIQSRSLIRSPLGISFNAKGMQRVSWNGLESASETCYCRGDLPDNESLRKRMERKLELEGLSISVDCVVVLNTSLDVFMKRLIKPCLELSGSRSGEKLTEQSRNWSTVSLNGMPHEKNCIQKQSWNISTSMLDFQVAMELNPLILGVDCSTRLEKVCLLASEE
ncbi:hypothetical protein V6N13_034627 [Hibiscus sabdariffa]